MYKMLVKRTLFNIILRVKEHVRVARLVLDLFDAGLRNNLIIVTVPRVCHWIVNVRNEVTWMGKREKS